MHRSPTILCSALIVVALTLAATAQAGVPGAKNVYVVLLENNSYSQALGGSNMPWLKSLGAQYTVATNYYANTHPSIGNYFMLTAGQIITNNDGYTGTVSSDNLARRFLSAGLTWKAYAESLPYAGYIGGDKYPYIKHHNPFAYFSDVRNSSTQKMNIVPFAQFAKDLANNATAEYSFIIPNNQHNAHDCPAGTASCSSGQKLRAADDWLKANIGPLLSKPDFERDGLLVVVFDESNSSDNAHGGGRVAAVIAGPKVKRGYQLSNFYQHQNLLRMMAEALGLSRFPGAAAGASNMSSAFGTSGPSSCAINNADHTVTICAPTSGATYDSPLHVIARTTSSTGVGAMAIYLDGVKVHSQAGNSLDTYVSATSGTHRLTVQAWDKQGMVFKSTIYAGVN
jgi:phosphatidylinositol-3-phosphatase